MSEAGEVRSFEDLECWKRCRELRIFVAKVVVPSLPKCEQYRLGDQLLRAARSATANIAEGYGRFHYLENAKFCSNARGSCWEVLDHLKTAGDEGLISPEMLAEGQKLVLDAVRALSGYLRYLQKAGRQHSLQESEVEYLVPTLTDPDKNGDVDD